MFRNRFVSSGLRTSATACLSGITLFALLILSGCGGSSNPVSVTVTASAATVDATDSVTLTATVANDKTPGGVTWTVTGGGTLSNTTSTGATYTAPAASSSAVTATVTATSVADTTKTAAKTLTVPPAPTITTGALAAGTVGTAYSATLAGSGGIAPYTWSLTSGTLPAGLAMNSAGVISGTPTVAAVGTASLTFMLTDSGTATALSATQVLGLTIAAAPAIALPAPSSLAAATYNVAYAGSVAATGGAGALTYSFTGALPTGLTLNAATGAIAGTPTAVGTFTFTIKAADAFGDSGSATFTITVSYPPVKVTAIALPTGYVGSNYTAPTLTATGGSGTGFTFTLAGGSALPAGLTLSTTGVISGKPTTAGPTSFTVTATDSASNTGNGTFSITVNAAVSITTATTLPTGYVGSNYSQTLAATGGSGTGYTWALSGGSNAPAGLNLSAAGVLSGKPTTTGTPSFTVTVTDSVGNTATATFTVTISAGVSITSANTLPGGYQGTAYPGATLTATGGTGTGFTWTWAAASGLSLPAGLTLSAGGAISGIPTGSGTFNIVVTVTDSVGNTASATDSLTVQATLTISSGATLPGGVINVPYSDMLVATGGSGGYTWATNSAGTTSLAAIGLSLSGAGVVSGASPTLGTATFLGTVTDSASHTASLTFSVTVSNALTVTTTSLPAAYSGTAYSQTLAAAGGSGTGYTWTITGTSNLATFNLALSAGGVLSGTPATSGTASFTAKVTDSASNTATQAFTFSVYNALALPAPNPTSLGAGTTGQAYSGSITASGGSGNYTWTVTGMPSDGLNSSSIGGTLSINGTPTTAQTVSFTASVNDTTTGVSVGPFTYTIVVSNPAPLALPAPNPGSLPSATVNQGYTGSISATGGASPYTFTVNSTAVPTNGTAVSLSNGLSVSSTGGNTLSVTGTPTTTTTVSFTASVTDNASHTAGPNTYTIAVNAAGSQLSGQIFLTTGCSGPGNVPQITVSINTTPVQTTTTDSGGLGNYSFASIPNGTYTITPSITGASSVFYPATQTVTVLNNTVSGENFSVALGYTVSGSVAYSGAKTGQVYLTLNGGCGGSGGPGTSITETTLTGGGAYTIRGVPPGSYTLEATMDNLGSGASNASNPSGSSSVTVTNANFTGANVTLADPAAVTLSSAPTLLAVSPASQGAGITYSPLKNSNGVETASSYTVQWSTSSGFGTVAGSMNFAATGAKGSNVWIVSGLTNGSVYYFRAYGTAGTSTSPSSSVMGPITIGPPTAGFAVSGTVTFTGITATGPLYVGFFNQSTGNFYTAVVGSKTSPPTSPAAYTVQVPSGTDYFNFAILDQNNNGLISGPGAISNINTGNRNNSSSGVTISGPETGQDVTLTNAGSTATVTTQYNQQSGGGSDYNLNFDVREASKLPVSVALTSASNPNVIVPQDFGACSTCGSPQIQSNANIGSDVPVLGDTYSLLVTYSDGTSETLTPAISGVLTASQLATSLSPTGTGGSTTPTFTWTYPANASSYIYQFYICCNANGTIWQIPGNNSNLNGFPSTVTQIVWGTDPTGDTSNTPSVTSLDGSGLTTYSWQLQTQDSNGNSAQASVNYTP